MVDEEEVNSENNENTEKTEEAADLSREEQLLALAEDFKRKWYAVTAEYENYRKRNAQAVSKAYDEGVSDAVLKLLPVSDTFGYAYDAATDDKAREGIDKVIKNFKTILQSLGVEEIEVNVGDPFDENVASAVLNFPCEEGEEPNTVKQILKKGYKQGDKVIRFAQVAVTI